MINDIIQWLLELIETMGYPGVAISMFLESFFAPVPSEVILPFAGFLASEGKMNTIVLTAVGGGASYLGTLPFYYIGKFGNRERVNTFVERWGKYLFIKKSEVDKAFELFDRFGTPLIFFGRLIPLVRSFISFPAGMARMNFAKFTGYTLLGSTLWSAFLVFAGYQLGSNYDKVSEWMAKYETVVFIIVGVGLFYLVYRKVKSYLAED
jgi:membrane protein DedA with SNARE-associated domain